MSVLSSAKDSGDSKRDKKRKEDLSTMVGKAMNLSESVDMGAYPEVKEAIDMVLGLKSLDEDMAALSQKIRSAPAGSKDALEAQSLLDINRQNIDIMITPLMATLETLEDLLLAAAEMESEFTRQKAALDLQAEVLKREKSRLATAAAAVKNSANLR